MQNLKEIRTKINDIDKEMMDLFIKNQIKIKRHKRC